MATHIPNIRVDSVHTLDDHWAYGERDFYTSRQMQLQDSGQAALMQGFAGGVSAGADTFSTVRAQNKIPIK